MKLPSIIVLLIHINSAYEGFCNSGKLTDQENKHRLNTCGIEGLPQPSPDSVGSDVPYLSDTWLCWGQNDPSDESISTASLISPRHLITSSELVLTREMHWRANGRNFDFQEDCRKKEREVFSPMIVEIDYDFNGSTPCLADNRMKIFNGSEADSYGLGRFEEQRYTMKHRKLTIAHTDNLLVFTESYKGEQRRGGKLIQRNQNTSKWTIIGFQASNNMKLSAFFNMKRLQNVLCELIGICPFSNSEIMFSMSSEFPISTSTSSEPTVSNSTSSESLTFTSKASTPMTRKPKPSVPSNTKTTINLKLDDSFESIPEELEKDYEENEEKGDDMGIDLYVSRDFFTDGNRGKGEVSWEHLVFLLTLFLTL
ncbi:hypothetical protein L5515_002216 [Caenorhabditis briggsae]|uniref:Uncharacterized protein n=1 Tax=Caenorhabditis briggsae TaxID=6238 RepID=A0AAE9E7T7_CAEBR|nr:hypothetical protein L5515_002216 [Caenorhabditis briggsae]